MGTKHVLFINGSLRGAHGNTAQLLKHAQHQLPETTARTELVLGSYAGTLEAMAAQVLQADGFVVGTGVYWGAWGSPLQRFLEAMTAYEVSVHFMGKPVVVLATMDSVGGSDLAQRLLGVFSNLGCLIPPLANVVVSRVGMLAHQGAPDADVWRPDDLDAVMHNLMLAMEFGRLPWKTWPVAPMEPALGSYEGSGLMMSGLPQFLHATPAPGVHTAEPTPLPEGARAVDV